VRTQAVTEAENGQHITKKHAEELIAEARQAAFEEAVAHYRADLETHVEDAVKLATKELRRLRAPFVPRLLPLQRRRRFFEWHGKRAFAIGSGVDRGIAGANKDDREEARGQRLPDLAKEPLKGAVEV
jgi:hypothetical protein